VAPGRRKLTAEETRAVLRSRQLGASSVGGGIPWRHGKTLSREFQHYGYYLVAALDRERYGNGYMVEIRPANFPGRVVAKTTVFPTQAEAKAAAQELLESITAEALAGPSCFGGTGAARGADDAEHAPSQVTHENEWVCFAPTEKSLRRMGRGRGGLRFGPKDGECGVVTPMPTHHGHRRQHHGHLEVSVYWEDSPMFWVRASDLRPADRRPRHLPGDPYLGSIASGVAPDVREDAELPQIRLTYRQLPDEAVLKQRIDDVIGVDGTYAMKLRGQDADTASACGVDPFVDLDGFALYDLLVCLTVRHGDLGDDAAGDLASAILHTLNIEWI
jgi:hypothetical protein